MDGEISNLEEKFYPVLSRVFRAGIFRCEGNRLSSTAVCSVCTFCRGRVYGVMGIEISTSVISGLLPVQELNAGDHSGYLMAQFDDDGNLIRSFSAD